MSADTTTAYEQVKPGDLISADLFNRVQTDIRTDIGEQVDKAIKAITKVEMSTDSEKLDGKTLDEIEKSILDELRKELPELMRNYRQLFKRLELNNDYVVKHDLGSMPLVDVYQLDYFPVICANGETPQDRIYTWVNFYLYHDSERTIRTQALVNGTVELVTVDVELRDETAFRVPFNDMLKHYKVAYDDNTSLDELVNGFWQAFFDPNGLNDDFRDQSCHSPWFDKCCGERRTVGELRSRRDWDHLWLKWRARKTINFPFEQSATGGGSTPAPTPIPGQGAAPASGADTTTSLPPPGPAPSNVQVVHFDWDQLGLRLLELPVYVKTLDPNSSTPEQPVLNGQENQRELKVMVLLNA